MKSTPMTTRRTSRPSSMDCLPSNGFSKTVLRSGSTRRALLKPFRRLLNAIVYHRGMTASDATLLADKVSYEDLYERWEKGNWSATALDFSEDKRQWEEELTPFQRKAALWNYSLFFWGEDAVADNLS